MSVALAHPASTIAADVTQAVSARELGVRFDDRAVLQDITLDIAAGQYVALVGANGAGKSTFLRVLATLLPAGDGEVRLFGQDLARAGPRVRGKIGLIGHQTMLYRDLTVRENLEFFGRLYGIADPSGRARLLMDAVGLPHRADDPVKSLSRGMGQRVAIARALMHSPDLLLADEPFAGLDIASALALEELLGHFHHKGRTIVLVNHDIGQSLRLAQRVLVLRGGRLVTDRPTSQCDAQSIAARIIGP
jgi:heme exporter protein A